MYFIGPRCKDTKDTELPCNTKHKYSPWACLAFLSSPFLTAIEGWSFPPAVSPRNNTATDFQPLVREEPRAKKYSGCISPSPHQNPSEHFINTAKPIAENAVKP